MKRIDMDFYSLAPPQLFFLQLYFLPVSIIKVKSYNKVHLKWVIQTIKYPLMQKESTQTSPDLYLMFQSVVGNRITLLHDFQIASSAYSDHKTNYSVTTLVNDSPFDPVVFRHSKCKN